MNTYQYFRNKLRFRSEKFIVPNQSFEILKSQEIMKLEDHVEKKCEYMFVQHSYQNWDGKVSLRNDIAFYQLEIIKK